MLANIQVFVLLGSHIYMNILRTQFSNHQPDHVNVLGRTVFEPCKLVSDAVDLFKLQVRADV